MNDAPAALNKPPFWKTAPPCWEVLCKKTAPGALNVPVNWYTAPPSSCRAHGSVQKSRDIQRMRTVAVFEANLAPAAVKFPLCWYTAPPF